MLLVGAGCRPGQTFAVPLASHGGRRRVPRRSCVLQAGPGGCASAAAVQSRLLCTLVTTASQSAGVHICRLDLVAAPRRRRVGMEPSHLHAIRAQRIRWVTAASLSRLVGGCWGAARHVPASGGWSSWPAWACLVECKFACVLVRSSQPSARSTSSERARWMMRAARAGYGSVKPTWRGAQHAPDCDHTAAAFPHPTCLQRGGR